jgi:hypothetical protein
VKHRKHKEKKFYKDVRILVDLMHMEEIHIEHANREDRHIWAAVGKTQDLHPAVTDLVAKGMALWGGKVDEYIAASTYDHSQTRSLARFQDVGERVDTRTNQSDE